MLAPDVELDDGNGTILISSEEGETQGIYWHGNSLCVHGNANKFISYIFF